jgi:hypothetical protein
LSGSTIKTCATWRFTTDKKTRENTTFCHVVYLSLFLQSVEIPLQSQLSAFHVVFFMLIFIQSATPHPEKHGHGPEDLLVPGTHGLRDKSPLSIRIWSSGGSELIQWWDHVTEMSHFGSRFFVIQINNSGEP